MSKLLKLHEKICGDERTNMLIDVLGSNNIALAWALRCDIENRTGMPCPPLTD